MCTQVETPFYATEVYKNKFKIVQQYLLNLANIQPVLAILFDKLLKKYR